jgi:bis(5'-nucleosidyl)-tetraphosphatase
MSADARRSTNTGTHGQDPSVAREVSCGVLLFQDRPRRSFLLLVDPERLDLPKGKIEDGEDELQCALRELEEETGIHPDQIRLVEGFRSVTTTTKNGRHKTVVLFAAEAEGPLPVTAYDHEDYAWVPWDPPHDFAAWPRIDRALKDWSEHLQAQAERDKRKAS